MNLAPWWPRRSIRLLDGGDPADDPAAVLAWRVSRVVDDDRDEHGAGVHDAAARDAGCQDAFRPPWLPAPCRGLADGSVGEWAIQQDRLIAGRVRALVEQVAVDPPAWPAGIRARREPGADRDRWEAAVGVVVAYGDQFRITDDADPLGAARVRVRGQQHQARLTAWAAWQRVQDHSEVRDQVPLPRTSGCGP